MLEFSKESPMPVTGDQLFRWHSRPGAFDRLCPPWQRIEIMEPAPSLDDGTRLRFRLFQGPIAMEWLAEHRDVKPPRQFRDVQVTGPMASWDHLHSFIETDGGSILRDQIRFALPLAALTESIIGRRVVDDMKQVFSFRHRTTAEDLTQHAQFADRPRLRVAVTGSGGLVGRALCAFLTTGGHQVVRLVRRPPEGDDEVEWRPVEGIPDVTALEGIDAVVALAGENIAAGRWTASRKQRLVSSRVAAVEKLVASLRTLERPPSTLITASAVGYYGDRGEELLDETASQGSGFLAELVQAWEAAALSAEDFGVRVAYMRFGVVLSPQGGALAKMLPAFRMAAGGPLGSGRQFFPWISIDDAVGAIYQTLMTENLRGAVNTVSPQAVTQGEFAKILGRVLRRPAVVPAPAFALRLALGEMADEALLASTRVTPAKLQAVGYEFRQPDLEDALRHLLGRTLSDALGRKT